MMVEIEEIAHQILSQNPDPVVRYRLLRDVLRVPPDSPDLQQTKAGLDSSRCVRELADEQWPDGGWGAFHSRNSKRRQKILTTEMGVERALALGLDAGHPILQKASDYIQSIMQGEAVFPDTYEKNDRWPTGMRLFLASTLSRIHPIHPTLDADRQLWCEIAQRTFQSGRYSEQDEIAAHADLTGATVKDTYLVLKSKYQLNILGSIPGTLPPGIERALLTWLWQRPEGIGNLGLPLFQPPPDNPNYVDRWLSSLELLSRCFPAWVRFVEPSIGWLLDQRDDRGYWDFGPRPVSSAFLPLSDQWRDRQNRQFDWTTRVLTLLRRYSKEPAARE